MNSHDEFLRAIHQDPADRDRVKVYADWLQEQSGDAHALGTLLRRQMDLADEVGRPGWSRGFPPRVRVGFRQPELPMPAPGGVLVSARGDYHFPDTPYVEITTHLPDPGERVRDIDIVRGLEWVSWHPIKEGAQLISNFRDHPHHAGNQINKASIPFLSRAVGEGLFRADPEDRGHFLRAFETLRDAEAGWRRQQARRRLSRASTPVRRYAQFKAPGGGMVVRGTAYAGGKFLPKEAVEAPRPARFSAGGAGGVPALALAVARYAQRTGNRDESLVASIVGAAERAGWAFILARSTDPKRPYVLAAHKEHPSPEAAARGGSRTYWKALTAREFRPLAGLFSGAGQGEVGVVGRGEVRRDVGQPGREAGRVGQSGPRARRGAARRYNQQEGFLRAIKDIGGHDPGPHLAFADHLDEQGNPALARLIRHVVENYALHENGRHGGDFNGAFLDPDSNHPWEYADRYPEEWYINPDSNGVHAYLPLPGGGHVHYRTAVDPEEVAWYTQQVKGKRPLFLGGGIKLLPPDEPRRESRRGAVRRYTAADEDAALRSISEARGDEGPHLVYADTLDERGDPLGSAIRRAIENPFYVGRLQPPQPAPGFLDEHRTPGGQVWFYYPEGKVVHATLAVPPPQGWGKHWEHDSAAVQYSFGPVEPAEWDHISRSVVSSGHSVREFQDGQYRPVQPRREARVRRYALAAEEPPVAGVSVRVHADAEPVLRSLFGRQPTDIELAHLASATDHSRVTTEYDRTTGLTSLTALNPHTQSVAVRFLHPGPRVTNDAIELLGADKGTGLAVFRRQVRAARALGVRVLKIDHAAGQPADLATKYPWSGYYVWPRFGFQGVIPPTKLIALPPEVRKQLPGGGAILKRVTTHDLFDLPGGAEAWKNFGGPLKNLEFDPHPDSPHSQRLEAYTRERLARRKMRRASDVAKEDDDRYFRDRDELLRHVRRHPRDRDAEYHRRLGELKDRLAAHGKSVLHVEDEPVRESREGGPRRYSAADHEAFQKAIMDDPLNPEPKLVYADWLQERGHPGGDYLRALHEAYDRVGKLEPVRVREPEGLNNLGRSFNTAGPVTRWTPRMARTLALLAFPTIARGEQHPVHAAGRDPVWGRAVAAAELYASGLLRGGQLEGFRDAAEKTTHDRGHPDYSGSGPWIFNAQQAAARVAVPNAHLSALSAVDPVGHNYGVPDRLMFMYGTGATQLGFRLHAMKRWLASNDKLARRLRAAAAAVDRLVGRHNTEGQ